jgi:glycosyltransferase involved in cell wall biosynthesis
LSRTPVVLHITGDYPDPSRSPTTVAIKQLIDSLDDCDHIIISLTRTHDPRGVFVREYPAKPGQRLFAVHHFGLPFGVGLFASFRAVARQIENLLEGHGLEPNMIHSHRLTFDGIAGWLISRRRRIPHVVSVRGEVESKVLRYKPSYRFLVDRILRDAYRIYYVSAWFRPVLEKLCPAAAHKGHLLPNMVANTKTAITPMAPEPRIVIAANLDIYAKKGVDRLISAFAKAHPRIPGVTLEIVGPGRDRNVHALQQIIETAQLGSLVNLRGALPNAAFLGELPRAMALAMPSRNETFGMVYTEALFAGIPILYGRGTGIDGHLDGLEVGIGVPVNDLDAIADGLITLVERNAYFRAEIEQSAAELFRRFDMHGQINMYMSHLNSAATAQAGHGAIHASQRSEWPAKG